jgi:hypothetical protein
VRTIILSHSSPLAFGKVGAPKAPIGLLRSVFFQPVLFGVHIRIMRHAGSNGKCRLHYVVAASIGGGKCGDAECAKSRFTDAEGDLLAVQRRFQWAKE